jgi:hypothetical protein
LLIFCRRFRDPLPLQNSQALEISGDSIIRAHDSGLKRERYGLEHSFIGFFLLSFFVLVFDSWEKKL